MGYQDRGDPKRTQTDPSRAVEDQTEEVGTDYVSRILQYEWADVLVSRPPETTGVDWVPGHVGKQWGRVAPDAWNTIREQGYDPHFRHYPTQDRFERGEFQFELWFGTVDTDGASVDADSVIADADLRDRIDAYVTGTPDVGSWDHCELVDESSSDIWRAVYTFPPGDNVAYYETLRRAIEDHEWMVELVGEAVDDAVE